jgi:hypothetical protein
MHSNVGHKKMLHNDRERLTTYRSGRKSGRKRHTLRDFRLHGS